jgi:hypothetical protein
MAEGVDRGGISGRRLHPFGGQSDHLGFPVGCRPVTIAVRLDQTLTAARISVDHPSVMTNRW